LKASVLLALLLLAACDSSTPYPELADRNLRVQTASTGAKVLMSVYRCGGEYEGTVVLDQPVVHVGLPVDRRSRLVFEFQSSGLLARTSIKKEVQLLPRTRYRYDALVTYKHDVYGVSLREIDPPTGEVRDLDPMVGC
jgi:hypothetical protein